MATRQSKNGIREPSINRLQDEDKAIHSWYRFVLSFPPHLVRDYLTRFRISEGSCVLDPFCGTGTTLVECKLADIRSVGIEAHPMSHFASTVKTDWSPSPSGLYQRAEKIAEKARRRLESDGLPDEGFALPKTIELAQLRGLMPEQQKLLLKNSISAVPLHKVLVLRDCILESQTKYRGHLLLALARALVTDIGNLHFGPEVGVGKQKADVAVVACWLRGVRGMSDDLTSVSRQSRTHSTAIFGDARSVSRLVQPETVDFVFTSPPYPNEKDYTRTTRLESVLLGFVSSREVLRNLKQDLVRSNTRGVYKADTDDEWVDKFSSIQEIAERIEARRIELGKTSGFERLYPRLTKLYFGGMARHFEDLKIVLKPGAVLGYVVGDQASYLRIMIRTGELLREIALDLGYEALNIDLFRERYSTATKEYLREEVLLLRWPG